MAVSKNGGTRSLLRGRVANDVYSIGKNAQGEKQQVVRSLAEQVANPRTIAQMRGRMIMSTVMQAVSQLSQIIDHSFDGFPAGQPSISEFIKRNYALVKEDVAAHFAGGNAFALNEFQVKGVKAGPYIVSDGLAVVPAAVTSPEGDNSAIAINIGAAAPTLAQVKAALGVASGDYFTKVVLLADGRAAFVRAYIGGEMADNTVITADNVAQVVSLSGNVAATISFAAAGAASTITIKPTLASDVVAHGIIVSQKKGSSWIHSNTTLVVVGDALPTAADALPTYPVGAERYLNGGDVAGFIEGGESADAGQGGNDGGGGGAPDDDDNSD